jgi:uncharacterized protein YukE
MADIDYIFPALATAASDVQARVSQIIAAVDQLAHEVNQARSTWISTSASGAYSELQRTWNDSELEVRTTFTRFGQAVGQAGQDMGTTERYNTSMLT